MKCVKIISALVLVLAFSEIYAQKGILKGIITDKTSKEPILFLNVFTADKRVATITDDNGSYQLELEPGTHEVTFYSLQYGETKKTVTIAPEETITLNVQLAIADIAVDEIKIYSERFAISYEDFISTVEVQKPDVLENKAATDITQGLEQVTGLTMVDNEPQLRGGSGYSFGAGSRVLIVMDGLPLMSGDAGRPSWGFIPIENIEQIEVVKGASSVLYGSAALNGIINVRTAYPTSTPKTVINLNSGVWDKPKMEQAKWWGDDFPFYSSLSFLRSKKIMRSDTSEAFSYTLGGNVYLERNYLGPARQDSLHQMHDDLNPGGYNHRARINFSTNIKAKRLTRLSYGIDGNFMYAWSTSILIWDNDTSGLYRSAPGATTTTTQPQFNLDPFVKYYDEKGNTLSLNTRVYYVNNKNNNDQQNGNTVFYGEFRYLKDFLNLSEKNKRISRFILSTGIMAQHVIGSSELYAAGQEGAVKRDQTNIAFYAQLDKKLWNRVNLTFGGRWEYFKEDSLTANRPIFRAGLSARISEKETYIRASFGQGFRFPTIAEKYIFTDIGGYQIVQNPNLKPEDSWSAEIGIKQGIKIKKFSGYLDLAGFTNYYKNYIEFIFAQWLPQDFTTPGLPPVERLGVGFKSVNTGRIMVSGIDASILGQEKFSNDLSLNMLIGYTWARPVALDPDYCYAFDYDGNCINYKTSSSDTSHYILKYRYEHLVKADIELAYKKFGTGFSFRAYSRMQNVDNIFLLANIGNVVEFRERNDGTEFVLDWRISYSVTESSKVALVVNNLLNQEYALRPLVINAPRSFALQYTLRL